MNDEHEDHGALVFTCPACGKDFTELGESCPGCGASIADLPSIAYTPPRSGLFKAVVWLILAALVALMITAAILALLPG